MNQFERFIEHDGTALRASAGRFLIPLSEDEIRQSLQRLLPSETRLLFRHNIFPVVWSPRGTLYAVAGRAAQQEAARRGLPVAAYADPALARRISIEIFGPRLRWYAIFDLAKRFPQWSARRGVAQAPVFVALIAFVLLSVFYLPNSVSSTAIAAVWSLFFLSVILLRLMSLIGSTETPALNLPNLSDAELPSYSILVPLFRETRVLDQLLQALMAFDYPASKLQILLVIEEIDVHMRRTLAEYWLPANFEIVVVPRGGPQTKPKALNYALPLARGELLTIYDAEDIPDPLQLRLAASAFAEAPPEMACFQAQLAVSIRNPSWLAKQFAIEYGSLFGLILPLLAKLQLPIPLGGTSNHIKTAVLRKLGAWDPFNVTEDADLGLRLARAGYLTGVLDSITVEDATVGLGNWISQRSRWLKGWMQTWLVHMRHPMALQADVGWMGFWAIQALLLGMIISALFHPFFIAVAAYHVMFGEAFSTEADWLRVLVMASCAVVFIMGYVVTIEAGRRGLRRLNIKRWYFSLLTMPVYWLLISYAAWRAAWELLWKPFVWNKTEHGLTVPKKKARGRHKRRKT